MAAGHIHIGRPPMTKSERFGFLFPMVFLVTLGAALVWWATHQNPSTLDIPLAQLTVRKLLNLLSLQVVGLVLGILWMLSAMFGRVEPRRSYGVMGQFGMVAIVPLVLVVWWFATL